MNSRGLRILLAVVTGIFLMPLDASAQAVGEGISDRRA